MPVEALSRGARILDEFRRVVLHARAPASRGRRTFKGYRLCRRPLLIWELVLVELVLSVSIVSLFGIVGR